MYNMQLVNNIYSFKIFISFYVSKLNKIKTKEKSRDGLFP